MAILQALDGDVLTALKDRLAGMSPEEVVAEAIKLTEANAKLKATRNAKLTLKVSEKGALSVYGMGKWPVTLYIGQWERLLDNAIDIRMFIEANRDRLSTKD